MRAQGASLRCADEAVPRYRYLTWRELETANSLRKQGMNVIATFQAADQMEPGVGRVTSKGPKSQARQLAAVKKCPPL